MASTKVTLRTAFNDQFIFGDVVVTQDGTTFPSEAKAAEVWLAAQQAGVTLYEVEAPVGGSAPTKTEGSGS